MDLRVLRLVAYTKSYLAFHGNYFVLHGFTWIFMVHSWTYVWIGYIVTNAKSVLGLSFKWIYVNLDICPGAFLHEFSLFYAWIYVDLRMDLRWFKGFTWISMFTCAGCIYKKLLGFTWIFMVICGLWIFMYLRVHSLVANATSVIYHLSGFTDSGRNFS